MKTKSIWFAENQEEAASIKYACVLFFSPSFVPSSHSSSSFSLVSSSSSSLFLQDLGNSIFSFLTPKLQFDKDKNNAILLKALARFKINGQASGRNDLEVDGKKVCFSVCPLPSFTSSSFFIPSPSPSPSLVQFSGSAFKHSTSRSLHHGTILIDLKTNALSQYLTPNKQKLASKGVSSVAARVINLKELAPELDHAAFSKVCVSSLSWLFSCLGVVLLPFSYSLSFSFFLSSTGSH
jgi:hypothetical protein